jgi:hypothetical protein
VAVLAEGVAAQPAEAKIAGSSNVIVQPAIATETNTANNITNSSTQPAQVAREASVSARQQAEIVETHVEAEAVAPVLATVEQAVLPSYQAQAKPARAATPVASPSVTGLLWAVMAGLIGLALVAGGSLVVWAVRRRK